MKPHKHAELIKAWADGAEIEMNTRDGWIYLESPGWAEECEYRIKPEPIHELHTLHCTCGNYWKVDEYPPKLIEKEKPDVIELIWSDRKQKQILIEWLNDTDNIKSAEVLK